MQQDSEEGKKLNVFLEKPPRKGESVKTATSEQDQTFDPEYNNAQRKEGIRNTFHTLVIWGLRIAALLVFAMVVFRVWHLFGPDCWLWLEDDRLQKIDSILFSGALGGLISGHLSEILHGKKS